MQILRPARQVAPRLLMAYAAFFATLTSFRLLLLPAIQHLFHTGDATTSFVRRTGLFCFFLLGYWVYVRTVEKRRVDELRPRPLGMAVGGLAGAGAIALPMTVLYAGGAYAMTAWRGPDPGLAGVACVIVIAALMEELVFRGILFRLLETGWGTVPAMWLSSIVFALTHIDNLDGHASPWAVATTLLSCTLLGAIWCLMFVHTRNLWVSTANHAAWNYTILLSGLPLSGIEDWRKMAPLASAYNGPDWLTGGAFGPEDSVLTLVLVVVALVVLHRRARAKNLLVRAPLPYANVSTEPSAGEDHA